MSTLIAGWSSPVARQAHNLKVIGSNPIPATNFSPDRNIRLFLCLVTNRNTDMQFATTHLSYCMNVHPASTLDEVLNNPKSFTLPISKNVSDGQPFGVGLWLPASSIQSLKEDITPLKNCLQENNLYLFTINGFPYGPFHGEEVKQKVYKPDWTEDKRVEYTIDLMDIMAALLPEGITGSISTVPVGYAKESYDGAMENIIKVADHARKIYAETSKKIFLALEPEPDCFLENTQESIDFFNKLRKLDSNIDEFVGLCFDTCHFALQNEHLLESYKAIENSGITIAKIQVSAALVCENEQSEAPKFLSSYDEKVYLHQTRVINDGVISEVYPDLGPALKDNKPGKWLVHFHVPLPFESNGPLSSTSATITNEFLKHAVKSCPNIEIETYTFDVQPEQDDSIVDSITSEFNWLIQRYNQ